MPVKTQFLEFLEINLERSPIRARMIYHGDHSRDFVDREGSLKKGAYEPFPAIQE
jgi:hypothetical protein